MSLLEQSEGNYNLQSTNVQHELRIRFEQWFSASYPNMLEYFENTYFDTECYRSKSKWNPDHQDQAWVLTVAFNSWQARQSEIDHLQLTVTRQDNEIDRKHAVVTKQYQTIQTLKKKLAQYEP